MQFALPKLFRERTSDLQLRLLVVFYAAVGVVYFVTTLGWSFATAFYAVAQILTTVGPELSKWQSFCL